MLDKNTDKNEVLQIFNNEYAQYRKVFSEDLNKFDKLQEENIAEKILELENNINNRIRTVIILVIVYVVVGVLVNIFLAHRITKPIKFLE